MKREEETLIKKRKTRSDKRTEIKPTISEDLKTCIYRLSYITNTPVKDVGEIMCVKGLKSRIILEYLSNYFRRDLQFSNTIFMGDDSRESIQRKRQPGKQERISIRFKQSDYDNICKLAYALDCTPSKATSVLLDASVRNTQLLDAYVKKYLHQHIDDSRISELKKVIKFINKENPYSEQISWFTLFSIIIQDIKEGTHNVKKTVEKWLDEKI